MGVATLVNLEENFKGSFRVNLEQYAGEWVALRRSEVISHGDALSKVYNEATKKIKATELFFTKVPRHVELFL